MGAPTTASSEDFGTVRTRAAMLSLVVGITLLATKLVAWRLTGSTAVLSDALESIVNVVAAAFALFSVRLAQKPADPEHPYGHGKVEFLSAAFEGGLIFLAGLLIIHAAVDRLVIGGELTRISEGLWLVVGAAAVNLVLGLYLLRVGRRTHSLTLEADGQHLLTDVWTSAASAGALLLVLFTGLQWLDPVIALLAALNILRIGAGLLRESIRGIMDEADADDLTVVGEVLDGLDEPLFQGWDRLRSRHQGHLHHVDLTVFVPGTATVADAHRLADLVERRIEDALGDAEVICHVEPESKRRAPERT